jgi:hypothetical protein
MQGAADQGVARARAVGDADRLDIVDPLALDAGVVAARVTGGVDPRLNGASS